MKKETRTILKARAMKTARKADEGNPWIITGEFLVFTLAGENYGIETSFIREVYPLKDFTALPCVPLYVFGIINLRGRILPVLDLKKLFNLPERGLGEMNKVIILFNSELELGILADDISGLQTIPLDSVTNSPVSVTGTGSDYLKGIEPGGVIMLEAQKILSDRKIIVHEEV